MLRILKEDDSGTLKPVTKKEQEKLCDDKKNPQNVGYLVNFDKPAQKARGKYPGLRPVKVTKEKASVTKASGTASEQKSTKE